VQDQFGSIIQIHGEGDISLRPRNFGALTLCPTSKQTRETLRSEPK